MFWSAVSADSGDDRAAHSDFWYQPLSTPTAAGVGVSPERALALPAVYSAVKVITDAIMQIPLIMYRRLADDGKERSKDHTLFSLLHDQPNEHQTSAEWREIMQHHVLLRGNAYSQISVGTGGRIDELGMPIHPDLVKPEKEVLRGGRVRFQYRVRQENRDVVLDASEILHVRSLGTDGISGLSPIQLEREAIGVGLAAQDFTARFLQNDATPGGYIEHPSNFKSDEQRKEFKNSWQSAQGGRNRRKLAVLEYGMKYHPVEVKLVDAQFLETRKYTNLDIARVFRVPPHLIMELDRATFSNITQQDIEFVKFTMLPWLKRWEQRLWAQLLDEDEQSQFFFEYLVDGLERGDGEARARYYKAGIQDGWLTRNEVRRRENLDPLDGLDEPLEPMNMRNPGGDNDERLNALKFNSAKACARKQRYLVTGHDDPQTFLRSDWQRVSQFMQCSTADAQRCCDFVANLYPDDLAAKLDFDAWEARQVKLLTEMT